MYSKSGRYHSLVQCQHFRVAPWHCWKRDPFAGVGTHVVLQVDVEQIFKFAPLWRCIFCNWVLKRYFVDYGVWCGYITFVRMCNDGGLFGLRSGDQLGGLTGKDIGTNIYINGNRQTRGYLLIRDLTGTRTIATHTHRNSNTAVATNHIHPRSNPPTATTTFQPTFHKDTM